MDILTYALLNKKLVNKADLVDGKIPVEQLPEMSSINYTVDYYAHNHIHQTGSILADIESPVNGTLAYVRNDLEDEYYSSQTAIYAPENCIGYWIMDGTIKVTSENYKEVTRSGFDGPYTFDNKNDYLSKYILTPDDYILITNDNIDELVTVDETEVYEFYMECGEWYPEDSILPAHLKGFYQYLPNENGSLSWQFVQIKSNLLNINFSSSFDVNQTYTFPVSTTNLETLFNPTILRVTWTNFLLPAANVNFVLHVVDGDLQLSTSCLVNIEDKNYNALTVITPNPDSSSQHQYIGNLSFVELGGGEGALYKHTLHFGTVGAEGQAHISFINDVATTYTAQTFFAMLQTLIDDRSIFIPILAGWEDTALSGTQVFNFSLCAVLISQDDVGLRISGYPTMSTSQTLDNVIYHDFTMADLANNFSDTVETIISGGGETVTKKWYEWSLATSLSNEYLGENRLTFKISESLFNDLLVAVNQVMSQQDPTWQNITDKNGVIALFNQLKQGASDSDTFNLIVTLFGVAGQAIIQEKGQALLWIQDTTNIDWGTYYAIDIVSAYDILLVLKASSYSPSNVMYGVLTNNSANQDTLLYIDSNASLSINETTE